jgi:hypothetical protein
MGLEVHPEFGGVAEIEARRSAVSAVIRRRLLIISAMRLGEMPMAFARASRSVRRIGLGGVCRSDRCESVPGGAGHEGGAVSDAFVRCDGAAPPKPGLWTCTVMARNIQRQFRR